MMTMAIGEIVITSITTRRCKPSAGDRGYTASRFPPLATGGLHDVAPPSIIAGFPRSFCSVFVLPAKAHDIPLHTVVNAFVKMEPHEAHLVIRVPLDLLHAAQFPMKDRSMTSRPQGPGPTWRCAASPKASTSGKTECGWSPRARLAA